MELKFEKNEATKSINLNTLRQTAEYHSRRHEIAHIDFISETIDTVTRENYSIEDVEIIIPKTGIILPRDSEVIRKGYESKYDVQGVIVNTLISRIEIPMSDRDYSQFIAIGYNPRGIEMAVGTNVKICSNMNILNKQNYLSNFGANKVSPETMLEFIAEYIKSIQDRYNNEVSKINKMKEYEVSPWENTIDEMIGKLHRLVEEELQNKTATKVMGHENIHKTMRLLMTPKENTVYEVYQSLTEVTTHQNVVYNRIPNTISAFEFVNDYFSLGYATN